MSWYVLGVLGMAACALCAIFLRNRPEDMALVPLGESADEQARRSVEPVSFALNWGRVYRSRLLWQLALIYFAFGFSYIIYATFFIGHLVKSAAFTPAAAGVLWMQVGFVSLAQRLYLGQPFGPLWQEDRAGLCFCAAGSCVCPVRPQPLPECDLHLRGAVRPDRMEHSGAHGRACR